MYRHTCRLSLVLFLAAAAVSCHDPDSYRLVSPTNIDGPAIDEILTMAAVSTSIRADGGSRTRVEARIDPAATIRTIAFTTSGGTLFGNGTSVSAPAGTNTTTQPLQITADANGVAAVELQSSALPGTATVTASVTVPAFTTGTVTVPARTLTRSIDISFVATGATDVITISVSPSNVEADGASRMHIVATVSTPVAGVNTQVEFTASNGVFASGTQNGAVRRAVVNLRGTIAEVDLIAPDEVGAVTITAGVGGFSAQTQVNFTRALPETVFVEVSQASVSRITGSVTITTVLFRDIGKVADNTVVTYTARDASGATIGSFSQVKLATPDSEDQSTNKRLKSTAVFDPDDTAVLGTATITVMAAGRSGAVTVQITN